MGMSAVFFNVFYNVLMILIVKYGSANIMFMALTLMVPLGNFAFSLPWVPGHQVGPAPTHSHSGFHRPGKRLAAAGFCVSARFAPDAVRPNAEPDNF